MIYLNEEKELIMPSSPNQKKTRYKSGDFISTERRPQGGNVWINATKPNPGVERVVKKPKKNK